MAHNYEHNPRTDAAGSRKDDETAVRPKKEGHNYPMDVEVGPDPIKEIRRDVDELIRTVNQMVRILRNWVNVYDPELMIESLQEIPTDE